jgi:hypothetical protein
VSCVCCVARPFGLLVPLRKSPGDVGVSWTHGFLLICRLTVDVLTTYVGLEGASARAYAGEIDPCMLAAG